MSHDALPDRRIVRFAYLLVAMFRWGWPCRSFRCAFLARCRLGLDHSPLAHDCPSGRVWLSGALCRSRLRAGVALYPHPVQSDDRLRVHTKYFRCRLFAAGIFLAAADGLARATCLFHRTAIRIQSKAKFELNAFLRRFGTTRCSLPCQSCSGHDLPGAHAAGLDARGDYAIVAGL